MRLMSNQCGAFQRTAPLTSSFRPSRSLHQAPRKKQRFISTNSSSADAPSSPQTTDNTATTTPSSQEQQEFAPLEGKFSYKQLRLLSLKQLKYELELRHLPTHGFKSSVAGRLYQAFTDEGRSLTSTESAIVDANLPSIDYDSAEESDMYNNDPLYALQRTNTGVPLESDEERLMSNKARLQATFMTLTETDNGIKISPSLALRTLQSVWMFDCGEDSQRALIGHPLLDWKRIERIFIGNMSPDSVLGLPGMLCTLSASRERGHENSDFPIHVFGPPGLVQFVSSMLAVSKTYLEMPVVLHEFTTSPVPPERLGRPIEVLKRSRIYAMQLPPDQLNPDGYYDGELSAMLDRHTRKRSGGGADLRSTVLPLEYPPPGDPNLHGSIPVSQMTWTVKTGSEFQLTAFPLKNKTPSFGFRILEGARAGKLYPEIAMALGVVEQKDFASLKFGESVETPNGDIVHPDQCVGPPKPGRSLAIVPTCEDSSLFANKAGPCDVVIHSMLPADVAGRFAATVDARELILWQQGSSFADNDEYSRDANFPEKVINEAREAYGGEYVSFGGSWQIHQWELWGDGPVPPPQLPDELRHMLDGKQ